MLPSPWVIFLSVSVWLGSLVGVGIWQNHSGAVAERADWMKRENLELARANELIDSLQQSKVLKETEHRRILSTISEKYEKGIQNVEDQKTSFIFGVRNGSILLRQPTQPKNSSTSSPSEVVTSPLKCDGETRTELQSNTAEFLFSESARADKIVLQLGACQEIVREDRRLCRE